MCTKFVRFATATLIIVSTMFYPHSSPDIPSFPRCCWTVSVCHFWIFFLFFYFILNFMLVVHAAKSHHLCVSIHEIKQKIIIIHGNEIPFAYRILFEKSNPSVSFNALNNSFTSKKCLTLTLNIWVKRQSAVEKE